MSALAAIHVARRQLGLDDDTARDLYERVTGKRSAKEMSEAERNRVVQELRRQGFTQPPSTGTRRKLEGPFAKKLQALWIAAWNLGLVADRRDGALLAFVKRQTGIDHTRFLVAAADADKAIEALKGWTARDGGVDWHVDRTTSGWARQPGAKIAMAQWSFLERSCHVPGVTFRYFVEGHSINQLEQMSPRDWRHIMNALGERVRAARKAGAA